MGETFYSYLGVGRGADQESIDRAYRARVTSLHPDVNDHPNASEQFQRLRIARDVLETERERLRYDRIGHQQYVREHVDSDVWTARPETPETTRSGTAGDEQPVDKRSAVGQWEAESDICTREAGGTRWEQTRIDDGPERTVDDRYVYDGAEQARRRATGGHRTPATGLVWFCMLLAEVGEAIHGNLPRVVVYTAFVATAIPMLWAADTVGTTGVYVSMPLVSVATLGIVIFHLEARPD